MHKTEDLIDDANELASKVLDTYRGRGQPKIQVEMAGVLRRLAAAAKDELAEADRVEASRECPDHPDALQMIRCTACNQERHMPA